MKSSYKNKDSVIKQQIREKVYMEFRGNVPRMNVGCAITLPNQNFWLENTIYEYCPRTYIKCFEHNQEIFQSTKYPPHVRILPIDIFRYKETQDVHFLYLDLCCSFIPDNLNKIAELMQKTTFCTNSTIAITLCHQHSKAEEYKNIKEAGFFEWIVPFIGREPENCKIFTYNCYDISPKANTMSCFILNFN